MDTVPETMTEDTHDVKLPCTSCGKPTLARYTTCADCDHAADMQEPEEGR